MTFRDDLDRRAAGIMCATQNLWLVACGGEHDRRGSDGWRSAGRMLGAVPVRPQTDEKSVSSTSPETSVVLLTCGDWRLVRPRPKDQTGEVWTLAAPADEVAGRQSHLRPACEATLASPGVMAG